MLAVSTIWNAARDGGLVPAIRRLRALGFEDVELASSGSVPDLEAVPEVLRELRIRVACADGRLGRDAPDAHAALEPDLASTDAARREAAVSALLAVAERTRLLGTSRVVIRCGTVDVPGAKDRWEDWTRRTALGGVTDEIREEAATLLAARAVLRDAHLDAACRALHRLSRADPETEWWVLGASRPDAIPLPDEIEHLLAELPGSRPAYVHDTAAARILADLGVAPPDRALHLADRSLAALRLSDAFGLEAGLPPGSGAVDWNPVRDASVAGLPGILHVTHDCGTEEIHEGMAHLQRLGLG